jgi:hypothetical protein
VLSRFFQIETKVEKRELQKASSGEIGIFLEAM